MAPILLSKDQVADQLEQVHGWTLEGVEIKGIFEFPDFVHAMRFVNSVALIAEKHNHHPDIDIRWNKVRLSLSTHSAGGLTELDFKLVKAIGAL